MPLTDMIANLPAQIEAHRLGLKKEARAQEQFSQQQEMNQQMMQLRDLQIMGEKGKISKATRVQDTISSFPEGMPLNEQVESLLKVDRKAAEEYAGVHSTLGELSTSEQKLAVEEGKVFGSEAQAITSTTKDPRQQLEMLKEKVKQLNKAGHTIDISNITVQNVGSFLEQVRVSSISTEKWATLKTQERIAELKAKAKTGKTGKATIARKSSEAEVTAATSILKGRDFFDSPGIDFSGDEYKRMGRATSDRALELQAQAKDMGRTLDETTARELAANELEKTMQVEKGAWWDPTTFGKDIAGEIIFPAGPSEELLRHFGETPTTAPEIPAEAIKLLEDNPTDANKEFFNETFGEGTAEEALNI